MLFLRTNHHPSFVFFYYFLYIFVYKMFNPWQRENYYRAASWWWGDSAGWALAGALHSELASGEIPLPQGVPNQTPIHGLNGKHDLASLTEDSAGNRPLQGNQVGRKQMMDSELLMDYFDFLESISPKRRSQQKQIKNSQDREMRIAITEN